MTLSLRWRRPFRPDLQAVPAQPDPDLVSLNSRLVKQVNDLTWELAETRMLLNTERERARYAGETPDASHWRRRSDLDRRNTVAICDALALSEGRQQLAPLADERLARRLRNAARRAVGQVLGTELELLPGGEA